jgi:AcrR family transcriptional regulator
MLRSRYGTLQFRKAELLATSPASVPLDEGDLQVSSDSSPARAIGRPREARADRAIRAAALELMAEHGVHSVRMDDVASRAGVGKATIYRRYRSKDELVIDAVGGIVDEIEVPDTGSTAADLQVLMRDAVELYSGSRAARLMPSVVDEMSRNPEFAAVARERFLSGRRAALHEVFERGVRRGDLRSDLDVELALDVLAGPLFYRLLITGGPIDERLAVNVVDLILRGFAPTPPRAGKPATNKRGRSK